MGQAKVKAHGARVALALLLVVALGVPGAGAISFWSEKKEEPEVSREEGGGTAERPRVALPDFTVLAEKLGPAVVNISTTSKATAFGSSESPFGPEDPFHEFWKRFEPFFGPFPPRPVPQKSLGSGFLINRDGYILTNNHVIEDAEEITVRLNDETEYAARIVGRDPKTDIAVIRIEGNFDIEPVVMGDSDALKVGEWVMAIGNPFGLDHTVTVGIVSAKGRFIGQGSYDNFIQTDAAINPGNSGGPLINLEGKVVGINTAIFSRTGGNIGIGFAIPINLAKDILPDLIEKGKVTRGWLGVLIQKVTPDIAESLGLEEPRGALVADVLEGPAREAGIKVGDVIVEFDGHAIRESSDLPLLVARTRPGKKVKVKVIRDGKPRTLEVTIAEMKEEEVEVATTETEDIGLTVQTLTPDLAESLGIERTLKGVLVTGVEPGSPADRAGLRRADVILEVDREPVEDADTFRKVLRAKKTQKSILLWVRRGENTIFLALKPKR
ncbi:MAG: peptidase [Candidatus Binatia bacterium]|nr:MAG: peptidase [Candidatus Binatia bacterium]